jgi:hypothetical protein
MPVSVGFLHAQARGIVFVGAVCKVQKDQHYCMARTQTKPHKHRRRDFMFFLQLFDQVFSAANAKKSDSMRNSTLGRDEPSRSLPSHDRLRPTLTTLEIPVGISAASFSIDQRLHQTF